MQFRIEGSVFIQFDTNHILASLRKTLHGGFGELFIVKEEKMLLYFTILSITHTHSTMSIATHNQASLLPHSALSCCLDDQ